MRKSERQGSGHLTPRERDCLRLLGEGLSTTEVAADLGIKKSTLESHLASARRKLGVATTRQAVVVTNDEAAFRPSSPQMLYGPEAVVRLVDSSHLATDLAHALTRCVSFEEGWAALVSAARSLGVSQLSFGLVAEPEGILTNGGRRIASTFLPSGFSKEIGDPDDFSRDPIGQFVTRHRQGRVFDSEHLVDSRNASKIHENLRAIAGAYLDCGLRFVFCQPGRDAATMAVNAFFYSIDEASPRDWTRNAVPLHRDCKAATDVFWSIAQEQRWLAWFSDLSPTQAAALRLVARGFSSAEAAENLGVSLRAFEKHLAGARASLKAGTNAQAVYRAMVYRAI